MLGILLTSLGYPKALEQKGSQGPKIGVLHIHTDKQTLLGDRRSTQVENSM